MSSIEELIIHHLKRPIETLLVFKYFKHSDWIEYEDGKLISLVSYFKLDYSFDMVVAINKDNIFTPRQWRVIFTILKNRTKEIRIQSDSSNDKLHKGAKRFGGYFEEDEIIFPISKE